MSSPLVEQVRAALTAARNNRDSDRPLRYSTLRSAIGNRAHVLGPVRTGAEAIAPDILARQELAG